MEVLSDAEITRLMSNGDWEHIIGFLEEGTLNPKRRIAADGAGKSHYLLLLCAVEAGATLVVKKLLELGESPNQKSGGTTLLMTASFSQNHEILELLLSAGADVNATARGMTALMYASLKCDTWAVSRLLKAGASPDQFTPKHQQSAIWFAASTDYRRRAAERTAVIRALAEAGCKMVGNELHWPVFRRDAELVKLLVGLGCPVNELIAFSEPHGPRKGEKPLTMAAETSVVDMASRSNEEVSSAKAEIVEVLLSAKADPNIPNAKGQPPLLLTVIGHQWDASMQIGGPGSAFNIAKLLLAAGADPMFCPPNCKNGSALDFAKKIKAQPFIELFTTA